MSKKDRPDLTVKESLDIKNKYLINNDIKKLAVEFNVTTCCILQHLRKHNISVPNNGKYKKKYTINEDYFREIDSAQKAYFLGFIYADGNVFKNRFKFSLWDVDKYFLENFAKEINFNGPIYLEKTKNPKRHDMVSLCVYSQRFVDNLKNLGVIENKTQKLNFPSFLKEDYIINFLHGYFDGDGSVTHFFDKNNRFNYGCSYAGCYKLISEIEKILNSKNIFGILYKVYNDRSGKLMIGSSNAIKLLNLLYMNKVDIFLKRKYNKYKEIINYLDNNRNRRTEKVLKEIDNGKKII